MQSINFLTSQQLIPTTKALVLQALYTWSQQILNLQLEFVSCFSSQNLPAAMNVVSNCVNCWYKKGKPVTITTKGSERFLWNFSEINWAWHRYKLLATEFSLLNHNLIITVKTWNLFGTNFVLPGIFTNTVYDNHIIIHLLLWQHDKQKCKMQIYTI